MTRPGIYRHHKGGLYRVLFVGRNSTNGSDVDRPVVVYMSMTTGKIHVRDQLEFHQPISRDVVRFVYVADGV